MQPAYKMPDILASWLSYIDTYEHLVTMGETRFDEPTAALKSSFAGALAASLVGGVADPVSGGVLVALPDGAFAEVHAGDADDDPQSPIPLKPQRHDAAHVMLVVFRRLRPVAVHLIPGAQLPALAGVLGIKNPAKLTVESLHWSLCLEPAIAREHGVSSYLITAEGVIVERSYTDRARRQIP